MPLNRSMLCFLALYATPLAAISAPEGSSKAVVVTPERRQQEALNKQLTRMNGIKPTDFCMRELRKLTRVKGAPEEVWFTALAKVAAPHGVNGHHLTLVQDRQVEVGMPICAAIASWGQPQRINRTQTARGRSEQWVYDAGNYIYFGDDQQVTSIQTSR